MKNELGMQNLIEYLEERFNLEGDRIYELSKHKLEDLKQTIQNIITEKYPRRHKRLLGVLSKAMPNEIFWELVRHFKDRPVIQAAILFDGIQAPRLNDLIKIKVCDINFATGIVNIYNSKAQRWYENPLQAEVKEFIYNWITNNNKEIEECQGYIFFDLKRKSHVHQNNLRVSVYKALQKMGINKSYCTSYDGRQLQLYSFHSLRGHAAMRIFEITHDIRAVQALLDHQPDSIDSTMLYIGRVSDLSKIINESIGLSINLKKSGLV